MLLCCGAAEQADEFPSSFFFVEGVFYCDHRAEAAIDLSAPVRRWAQSAAIQPGVSTDHALGRRGPRQFGTARMEDTTFAQLPGFRLGKGYLFCHQADCEHMLVFTDLRFHHACDQQDASRYPLIVFQTKIRRRLCAVCSTYAADVICYGSPLTEASPCFLCKQCYHLLHYDAVGNLLVQESFQVFDYHHD